MNVEHHCIAHETKTVEPAPQERHRHRRVFFFSRGGECEHAHRDLRDGDCVVSKGEGGGGTYDLGERVDQPDGEYYREDALGQAEQREHAQCCKHCTAWCRE